MYIDIYLTRTNNKRDEDRNEGRATSPRNLGPRPIEARQTTFHKSASSREPIYYSIERRFPGKYTKRDSFFYRKRISSYL